MKQTFRLKIFSFQFCYRFRGSKSIIYYSKKRELLRIENKSNREMFCFEICIEIYLYLFTNIKQKYNEQQSFTFITIDLIQIHFTFYDSNLKTTFVYKIYKILTTVKIKFKLKYFDL